MALDPSVFDRRDPVVYPSAQVPNDTPPLGTIGSVIGGIAGGIFGGGLPGAMAGSAAGKALGGLGESALNMNRPRNSQAAQPQPSASGIDQLLQMLSKKKPGEQDQTVGDALRSGTTSMGDATYETPSFAPMEY